MHIPCLCSLHGKRCTPSPVWNLKTCEGIGGTLSHVGFGVTKCSYDPPH